MGHDRSCNAPHRKPSGNLAVASSGLLLAGNGWKMPGRAYDDGSGVGSTVAVTTGWVAIGPTWFQRSPSCSFEKSVLGKCVVPAEELKDTVGVAAAYTQPYIDSLTRIST